MNTYIDIIGPALNAQLLAKGMDGSPGRGFEESVQTFREYQNANPRVAMLPQPTTRPDTKSTGFYNVSNSAPNHPHLQIPYEQRQPGHMLQGNPIIPDGEYDCSEIMSAGDARYYAVNTPRPNSNNPPPTSNAQSWPQSKPTAGNDGGQPPVFSPQDPRTQNKPCCFCSAPKHSLYYCLKYANQVLNLKTPPACRCRVPGCGAVGEHFTDDCPMNPNPPRSNKPATQDIRQLAPNNPPRVSNTYNNGRPSNNTSNTNKDVCEKCNQVGHTRGTCPHNQYFANYDRAPGTQPNIPAKQAGSAQAFLSMGPVQRQQKN